MNMESILGLCGGLALFLYGMHMMSDGLEAVAGERMKQILEKLTSSTFKGVLVGTPSVRFSVDSFMKKIFVALNLV